MSGDDNRVHIEGLHARDVALLKQLVKEGTRDALDEFSISIGLDPEEPLRTQRNMQFLDKTRERYEGIHGKVIITAIGIAVAGAVQAAWAGFKTILTNGQVPGAH